MTEIERPAPGQFESVDGRTRVECRFVADAIWLTQDLALIDLCRVRENADTILESRANRRSPEAMLEEPINTPVFINTQ